MSPKRHWAGLVHVEVVSGMAQDAPDRYRGFVTVRALAEDGSFMAGQLDPATLRSMAMQFLGAAEAAEQDAIVMTLMTRELHVEVNLAAQFVRRMRDERPD